MPLDFLYFKITFPTYTLCLDQFHCNNASLEINTFSFSEKR